MHAIKHEIRQLMIYTCLKGEVHLPYIKANQTVYLISSPSYTEAEALLIFLPIIQQTD